MRCSNSGDIDPKDPKTHWVNPVLWRQGKPRLYLHAALWTGIHTGITNGEHIQRKSWWLSKHLSPRCSALHDAFRCSNGSLFGKNWKRMKPRLVPGETNLINLWFPPVTHGLFRFKIPDGGSPLFGLKIPKFCYASLVLIIPGWWIGGMSPQVAIT